MHRNDRLSIGMCAKGEVVAIPTTCVMTCFVTVPYERQLVFGAFFHWHMCLHLSSSIFITFVFSHIRCYSVQVTYMGCAFGTLT